ncbi:hypothetical protein DRE_04335 [Drechslerella stenobrocha 248]|uniref:Uncharacterized protein n=1 Tax=Drechslerella stenobrocha 248 TaxID=1043628 RepID=W7I1K4_9PEZI|nr:hypothetical protein DRE_04335 [Drechslerella stenobrocha 248]
MTTTFTINIRNEDPQRETATFWLYQAAPTVSKMFYAAVYQSIDVDLKSTGKLTIIAEPYAIVATTKSDFTNWMKPTIFDHLDSRPVQLTKRPVKGSVVCIDCNLETGLSYFDDAKAATTTTDASFRITASENVQPADEESTILMGMGAKNPGTGEIVPIAILPAQAGKTLTFTPELSLYYIACGKQGHARFDKYNWVDYDGFEEVDFRGKSSGAEISMVLGRHHDGWPFWAREDHQAA